jgi:ABC-2 type transport system permease protein
MLGSVFAKCLRDQRWALLGWSAGIAFLVLVEAAVWPTMRDMPNLDELLQGYPDAMKELFDLDAMSTAQGFMNAELFTLVLPMLFIVFAVSRGARLIAGEEERGTLDVVLLTPVSTRTLLLQKAAAVAVSVLSLGLVLFASLLAAAPVFDLDLGIADVASGALAMSLLGIEFGFLSLAVGAATGRRTVALAVAGVLAVAGYVLYALGQIVDAVEPWQPLSPFHQAVAEGPLGAGLPASFGWLAIVASAVIAAAVPVFGRRDIRTP